MIDNNGKITKLKDVPILGLFSGEFTKKQNLHPPRKSTEGRIVVYGDSSCLDSVHLQKDCFWMLEAFLQFTTTGTVPFIFQHSHQNSKDDSSTLEDYDKVHVETLFANRTSKEQINCLFLEWEKPIIMMNESLPANIYKSQKSILLNNLEMSSNNILPDMIVNNLENEDLNKLERNSFKQVLEYESGGGSSGKSQIDQDQVNSSILTFNNCILLLSIIIIFYLLNNLFKCFNFRTLRRKFILFNFNFNFNNSASKKVKRRKLSTEVDNDWLLEETLTTNPDNVSNL